MTFTLPQLSYAFDALEPFIDAKTMEIHHDKHHAAYIKKLNETLEGTQFLKSDIKDILKNIKQIPQEKRQAVINHGGGHANHSLFWELLAKEGGKPSQELTDEIKKIFGSMDEFKKIFSDAASTRFGSGWAWLVVTSDGKLEIRSTSNQDSPLMENQTPILALDVWEHAYYLKYQNKRPDYIEAFWNVVNWNKVNELFAEATQ